MSRVGHPEPEQIQRMTHKTRIFPVLLALAAIGIVPASPSLAQEKMQDETARSEFIYRVNLGRADDVRLLMRQGASPNQVSGEGVPVMCLAAGRIDPEGVNIIEALLEGGANVNARDRKGQTPLFYAAKAGNQESITYLMDNHVDSYALDNNGDVARTAAYKAGQKDSVRTIDDYILKQTAEVTQQYRMRNREMARSKGGALDSPTPDAKTPDAKAPDPAAAPTAAPAAPPAPGATAPLPEATPADGASKAVKTDPKEILPVAKTDGKVPAPAAPESPAADDASPDDEADAPDAAAPESPAGDANAVDANGETAQEKADRMKEESSQRIYDMTFNVCAFQYWSYCSSAKQSVDLDAEELIVAISSSKTAAEKTKNELIRDYSISKKAVETIATSAQRRIYKDLNSMASNRDRHEKGVGKRDDMQERCEFIARQWGEKAPGRLANPDADDGGNGKGGSKGAGGGGAKGAGKSKKSGGGAKGKGKSGGKKGAKKKPHKK